MASHFELPPPKTHERYMPRGFIFTVDAKGCFCNIPIRVQDRKFLCFWDETLKSYVAYNHAAFGFAAGPEYADTLMKPIVNWMKHGFAAALWIDDIMAIFDKLDLSSEQCSYLLSQLLRIFEWLRIRLNRKCILMPVKEVTFTGMRVNVDFTRVLADCKKLMKAWILIRSTRTKKSCSIVTLKSIIGRLQYVLGPSMPKYYALLQRFIIDSEHEIGRKYPKPHGSAVAQKIQQTLVLVPNYLVRMLHEVLRIVESTNFSLSPVTKRPCWSVITDVGEEEAGGFAYTSNTSTRYFNYSLPLKMRPIEGNSPTESSSSIRELWGIVQVMKDAFQTCSTIHVNIRVDNTNVVGWLQKLNPVRSSHNVLLRKLIAEYYNLVETHDISYEIDHHPREQPAAEFADYMSKLHSIHIPWNKAHVISLTLRGFRVVRHFRKKFEWKTLPKIYKQNCSLPWKALLSSPQPWLKPLVDLLRKTPILCIPFGFHRNIVYKDIIENLIRFKYSGAVICPDFPQAINICNQYFTTRKTLRHGKNFHFRLPSEALPEVNQIVFFMERGGCW